MAITRQQKSREPTQEEGDNSNGSLSRHSSDSLLDTDNDIASSQLAEKLDHEKESLTFVKRLMFIAAGTYLKHRRLASSYMFRKRRLDGLEVWTLDKYDGEEHVQILLGCAQAIEKKYARELIIVACEGRGREDDALEVLTLRFAYTDGASMQLLDSSGRAIQGVRYTNDADARRQARKLVENLVNVCSLTFDDFRVQYVSNLAPLSPKSRPVFNLTYYQATPLNYNPPSWNGRVRFPYTFNGRPYEEVQLGFASAKFHAIYGSIKTTLSENARERVEEFEKRDEAITHESAFGELDYMGDNNMLMDSGRGLGDDMASIGDLNAIAQKEEPKRPPLRRKLLSSMVKSQKIEPGEELKQLSSPPSSDNSEQITQLPANEHYQVFVPETSESSSQSSSSSRVVPAVSPLFSSPGIVESTMLKPAPRVCASSSHFQLFQSPSFAVGAPSPQNSDSQKSEELSTSPNTKRVAHSRAKKPVTPPGKKRRLKKKKEKKGKTIVSSSSSSSLSLRQERPRRTRASMDTMRASPVQELDETKLESGEEEHPVHDNATSKRHGEDINVLPDGPESPKRLKRTKTMMATLSETMELDETLTDMPLPYDPKSTKRGEPREREPRASRKRLSVVGRENGDQQKFSHAFLSVITGRDNVNEKEDSSPEKFSHAFLSVITGRENVNEEDSSSEKFSKSQPLTCV